MKECCYKEDPYKIPDYKIYKVEDVPLLKKTHDALAARGLRDPWLRNEVWRYNPDVFGTFGSRTRTLFLRGFPFGLAAAIITIIGTEAYNRLLKKDNEGHH